MNGRRRILASVVVIVALILGSAGPAQAAVSVTRASVSGTTLKLEGRAAASRPITVDGVPCLAQTREPQTQAMAA